MKNLLVSAAALGLVASSVGCLQERTYLDPRQDLGFGGDGGLSASNMNLRDGRLRGDFGARRGFDGAATDLQGSNDVDYRMTTVNVVREEAGRGAGMVILSTSGRTLDELPVGEHAFNYEDASLGANEEVFVNVCGGADAGAFDYDAPAREGTVTIEEDASGNRTVSIHTETPVVDPSTGVETGAVETSDSTFTYAPTR
jgi:hypothetical protein